MRKKGLSTTAKISIVVTLIICVVAGGLYYAAQRAYVGVFAVCLGKTLDTSLDILPNIHSGGFRVFRQQAEAAARIHIKRVEQGLESFCPLDNMMGKWKVFRQYVSGSWLTSERTRIAYDVASKALAGTYEYEWPASYGCVDAYASTRMPNTWLRRFRDRSKAVGTIQNMTLYCTGGLR